jgi:hypothetical protein
MIDFSARMLFSHERPPTRRDEDLSMTLTVTTKATTKTVTKPGTGTTGA